jgi:hypothetical protein
MKEKKRIQDDRDDTAAVPSMGGTQEPHKDSTDRCDTRRLGNRPPSSTVEDAEVQPDSRVQKAKEKQLGKNYKHNTN